MPCVIFKGQLLDLPMRYVSWPEAALALHKLVDSACTRDSLLSGMKRQASTNSYPAKKRTTSCCSATGYARPHLVQVHSEMWRYGMLILSSPVLLRDDAMWCTSRCNSMNWSKCEARKVNGAHRRWTRFGGSENCLFQKTLRTRGGPGEKDRRPLEEYVWAFAFSLRSP